MLIENLGKKNFDKAYAIMKDLVFKKTYFNNKFFFFSKK